MSFNFPAQSDTWPVEVCHVLAVLATDVSDVLGSRLLGLYVFGSLVTGDFDTDVSDVDLVAVLESDLSDAEFRQLNDVHVSVIDRHPLWEDRLEIIYVSKHALASFRTTRSPLAKVGSGTPFHIQDAGVEWIAEWFVAREYGAPLVGPFPSRFIPPIALAEVTHQLCSESQSWTQWVLSDAHPGGQAYGILTACRTLYLATNGRLASKIVAARWSEQQFPEWASLIDLAVKMRSLGGWVGEMDSDHTRLFLRFAIDRLLGDQCR